MSIIYTIVNKTKASKVSIAILFAPLYEKISREYTDIINSTSRRKYRSLVYWIGAFMLIGLLRVGMTCDTGGMDETPDSYGLSTPGTSGGSTTDCFEDGCDNEVAFAIWEDNLISGKYLPVCSECDEDRPEYNLWDASAIEDDEGNSHNERSTHPVPEDEEWAVIDSSIQSVEEFNEEYPNLSEDMYEPSDPTIEIFLRDPEDSDALEEARNEARKRFGG